MPAIEHEDEYLTTQVQAAGATPAETLKARIANLSVAQKLILRALLTLLNLG